MPYTLAYATVLLVKSNHYDIEGMHGKNFILKYGYYHLTTHTYCQARPQTQPSPNPVKARSQSVPRGLGLTLKSYGPHTTPPHP